MPHFLRISVTVSSLTLLSLLPACTFFDSAKPPLKGTRESIFQEIDIPKKSNHATTPQVSNFENSSRWTTLGGTSSHTPAPMYLNKHLKKQDSTSFYSSRSDTLNQMSPLVYNNVAYLIDRNDIVYANNLESMDEIWSHQLPYKSDHYAVGGLSLIEPLGQLVATTAEGYVTLLDAKTGKEIWQIKTDEPIRSAPATTASHIFLVTKSNKLIAIDNTTGKIAWTYAATPENLSFLSNTNPSVLKNRVLVLFSSGDVIMFRGDTGADLWQDKIDVRADKDELSLMVDTLALPLLDDQFAFIYNQQQLAAFDQRNGRPIWELPLKGHLTPSTTDNHLFVVDDRGYLFAVEKSTGKIAWSTKLPESKINRFGPYVTSNGILVFNDANGLFFDIETGKQASEFELDAAPINPPTVTGGAVFVLDSEKNFAIYK